MITGARNYIEVPPVAIAHGGVIEVATVIDVTDPHDLLGAEYLADACADPELWYEFCTLPGVTCPPGVSPTGVKEFGQPELVVGDPFAVYAGVECNLMRLDESLQRAERRLGYTESRAIDRHVREMLVAEAVEVGPGPYPVFEAIGILEGAISGFYGGVPTLIVDRSKVICACAMSIIATGPNGSLTTCLGTPVAAVTGDPDNPEPESYAFITGRIVLLRGPVSSFVAPPHNDCNGVTVPSRALAERIYVPMIECWSAKTLVTCT